jgi:aminopeptidase N
VRNGQQDRPHEDSQTIEVVSYDLALDLTRGDDTFSAHAEIRFRRLRAGPAVFADLRARRIRQAVLNGLDLEITHAWESGRLRLPGLAQENTLVVDADFGYTAGEPGLIRQALSDGSGCAYSRTYPGGAPGIFCCFDQTDLRAPFTVSVNAPAGWSCRANGLIASRPAEGAAGLWKFSATSPIAPYLFSLCAGPFTGPSFPGGREPGRPLPVTASALPTAAASLRAAVNSELFRLPLHYYERSLGTPYPYGKCDVVFVPAFTALAFGAPGLVTVQDQVLEAPRDGRHALYLATVVAHELAHAWLGGLADVSRREDTWIIEPLTTYLSRTALEEIHPGAAPWATRTSLALPDHAYSADAAVVRQLENLIGRQAVLGGLRALLRGHANRCFAKGDLVQCWSSASGRDLSEWAATTFLPATSDA